MDIDKRCITHNLPDDICGPCNAAREERERIINILMTRLEQFDCDICGDCITPKRLAEMIREQAQENASN